MKFLFIALIIRLIVTLLISKKDSDNTNEAGLMNNDIRHPAEFELR